MFRLSFYFIWYHWYISFYFMGWIWFDLTFLFSLPWILPKKITETCPSISKIKLISTTIFISNIIQYQLNSIHNLKHLLNRIVQPIYLTFHDRSWRCSLESLFELKKDAELKQQSSSKSERENELGQLQSKLAVMQAQLDTSNSTINNLTVDLNAISQKYKNLEDSNKNQVNDLTSAKVKSKTH